MKHNLFILFLLVLTSCDFSSEEAPTFSLENITDQQLPAYNLASSSIGDYGQSYYTIEWNQPLTEEDSVSLKSLLSDFYADDDNNFFKCYAQGDSSVCLHFNDNGLIVTKEKPLMFKGVIEEVFSKAKVKVPENITPLYYKAWYGFSDSSYEIGFDKSLLSAGKLSSLIKWADTTTEGSGISVRVTEGSINCTPIIIIHYSKY